MLVKLVGACIVLICLVLGGFLSLMSLFAIMDGKDDEVLYLLALCGVALVAVGLVLMLRLARPKPARHRDDEEDEDEYDEDAGW
jgi:hypothetical protein